MSWSGRRKGLYIGVSLLIFLSIVGFVAYTFLSKPSSCFNNVKDGTELDVDCGGACSRMCIQSVRPPLVLWTRFLSLAPSTYTVVAYIENQNNGSYVKHARYTFKLFDANNVLIAERQGVTSIAPTRITPVVETNIQTGSRVPARAFFEFLDTPMWDTAVNTPSVRVDNENLSPTGQRLSVVVHNDSAKRIDALPVAVTLFDQSGAAQAASVSVIDRLEKGEQTEVVFTWPQLPLSPIVRSEVIPLSIPQ